MDLFELHPAEIYLNFHTHDEMSSTHRTRAVTMLDDTKSAGVDIVWIVEARGTYFGFYADPTASGFSQIRIGEGGMFGEIIS